MPRVEIIPENWKGSRDEQRGDGTPTVDVCRDCHEKFFKGDEQQPLVPERPEDVDEEMEGLAKRFPKAIIGSTDVDHPPFEGEDYSCECCGATLTEEDD